MDATSAKDTRPMLVVDDDAAFRARLIRALSDRGLPVTAAWSDDEAMTLARVESEHIQRVLNDCEGNISRAARRLKIHRRSLQRKLSTNPAAETGEVDR